MKKGKNRFFYLHMLVIIYLISAFSWWAILLFTKNNEVYSLQKTLSEHTTGVIDDQFHDAYLKQKRMIMGEGLVFGISILFALFLVNRAYRSELHTNKRLNDFLLSVTHELKTPIAAIKLANQTLLKKNLNPELRSELVATNLEEAARLESQVNNILAAAQLEQAYKFNFEKTDLSALIQDNLKRFKRSFPNRTFYFDPKESFSAMLDKETFTKVMDNILSNAVKYSPDNSNINLNITGSNKSVALSVTDQGSGIAQNELDHVWDKFYRIENEETRTSKGTGLGLWIAKKIVEAHHGRISIKDTDHNGTTIEIILPKAS